MDWWFVTHPTHPPLGYPIHFNLNFRLWFCMVRLFTMLVQRNPAFVALQSGVFFAMLASGLFCADQMMVESVKTDVLKWSSTRARPNRRGAHFDQSHCNFAPKIQLGQFTANILMDSPGSNCHNVKNVKNANYQRSACISSVPQTDVLAFDFRPKEQQHLRLCTNREFHLGVNDNRLK